MAPVEARVPVEGGALRVLAWGPADAPPVLLFHGFGQTADFLAPLAEAVLALAPRRVLAPDLRAHGQSPDFTAGQSADDVLVADARALHAWAGATPAVWFGNSLGARVAGLACAAAPSMARRLVLGETLLGLDRVWAFLLAGVRRRLGQHPGIFANLAEARAFATDALRLPPATVELWLEHAVRPLEPGDPRVRWTLQPGIVEATWLEGPAIRERLPRLAGVEVRLLYAPSRAPGANLRPTADTGSSALSPGGSALSKEQKAQVAALFPSAPVLELPGCSHDLFLDDPVSIAKHLVIFSEAG